MTKKIKPCDQPVIPLIDVYKSIVIDGKTFQQYLMDCSNCRAEAIAAGWVGEPYDHYHTTKGRYNGKVTERYKPMDNGQLFAFAKQKYSGKKATDAYDIMVSYDEEQEIMDDWWEDKLNER